MRPGFIIAAIAVAGLSGPAIAQSNLGLAMEMGRILAYEEACDLAYDQDAIVALVQDRVSADDIQFNGAVALSMASRTRELGDQSQSALTLYCTQVEQTARSFGFIE